MDDYKEIIKEMLSAYFTPNGTVCMPMATKRVLRIIRGIIPNDPIDEHDIFAVLREMGFSYELYATYEKDESGNDTDEIKDQLFLWNLFPINTEIFVKFEQPCTKMNGK